MKEPDGKINSLSIPSNVPFLINDNYNLSDDRMHFYLSL